MKTRPMIVGAAAALFGALLGVGCGGGGGGGSSGGGGGGANGISLTGVVAAPSLAPGRRAVAVTASTWVWAIPIAKMQGASIDSINVLLREEQQLGSDLAFSFDLAPTITKAGLIAKVPALANDQFLQGLADDYEFEVDWIIVLVDKAETPYEVELVELAGGGAYEGLLALPLSSYTGESLDMGTITDGIAATTTSSLAGVTGLSDDSLKALSQVDDMMRSLRDIIRNCEFGAETKCVSAQQSFTFLAEYTDAAELLASGNPMINSSYQGYQLYFDLTDYYDSTEFDKVCGYNSTPVSVKYELTPPVDFDIDIGWNTPDIQTYGPTRPMHTGPGPGSTSNNGDAIDCFKSATEGGADPHNYLRRSSNTDWNLQFLTGDQNLVMDTSEGDWLLKRYTGAGLDVATTDGPFGSDAEIPFAFGTVAPVNGTTPFVFVPGVYFDSVVDGNGTKLTRLYVKWYRHNGTGYELVDPALVADLVGGFEVSMEDYCAPGSSTCDNDLGKLRVSAQSSSVDPVIAATTGIDVTALDAQEGEGTVDPFYLGLESFNPALTVQTLDYLGIGYGFAGQNLRFAYRKSF